MTAIGVLDRTGTLLGLVEQASAGARGVEVVALGPPGRFGPHAPRVDVLVLGPREVTLTGLGRAVRWHAAHPAASIVATLDIDSPWSREDLASHGVHFVLRGESTPARLGRVLQRCYSERTRLAVDVVESGAIQVEDLSAAQAHSAPPLVTIATSSSADEEAELDDAATWAWSKTDRRKAPRSLAGRADRHRDEPDPEEPKPTAAEPEPEPAPAPTPAPGPEEELTNASRQAGDGVLITIASATGGSGKTFYATNLAAYLASTGQKVLLVDLDLQFGEVAPVLQIRHPYSVYDGLYGPDRQPLPHGALADQLDQLVCRHSLGFDVLTAPRDPSLADYVGASDAVKVLDAVLPRYETVIVDTPPSLNEVVLVALDRSDVVPVLATLDVPSLKNLAVFQKTVKRLRLDDGAVRLVLNKVEPDVGITVKQAQEAFNGRFIGFVPADRAVSRSINSGHPIVISQPRSKVSKSLIEAIRATYPRPLGEPVAAHHEAGSNAKTRRWWQHFIPFRRPVAGGITS